MLAVIMNNRIFFIQNVSFCLQRYDKMFNSQNKKGKFALKRRKVAFLREKKHLMKKKYIFFRLALNLFFVMTSNY